MTKKNCPRQEIDLLVERSPYNWSANWFRWLKPKLWYISYWWLSQQASQFILILSMFIINCLFHFPKCESKAAVDWILQIFSSWPLSYMMFNDYLFRTITNDIQKILRDSITLMKWAVMVWFPSHEPANTEWSAETSNFAHDIQKQMSMRVYL